MKCGLVGKRLYECKVDFNEAAVSPDCEKYIGLRCKPCLNNFCLDLDTKKCKIRGDGVYADEMNWCTKCQLGPETKSNIDKGYACVCKQKHYWSGKSRTCIKCPENTYENTEVSDPPTCRHCSVGATSEAGSRVCKCSAGSFFNNGRCKLCPTNTFKSAKTQKSARNVHQV